MKAQDGLGTKRYLASVQGNTEQDSNPCTASLVALVKAHVASLLWASLQVAAYDGLAEEQHPA